MFNAPITPAGDNPECIYVFDFDDTIVQTNTTILVKNKNTGEIIGEIEKREYYDYVLQPGERFEFLDNVRHQFERQAFRIFIDALEAVSYENVWICTARIEAEPVQAILTKHFGLEKINIAAVGIHHDVHQQEYALTNAKRKKLFIEMLIRARSPEALFFYDDSELNLQTVGELSYDPTIMTRILLFHTFDSDGRVKIYPNPKHHSSFPQ